jgi:hypothetical protein
MLSAILSVSLLQTFMPHNVHSVWLALSNGSLAASLAAARFTPGVNDVGTYGCAFLQP